MATSKGSKDPKTEVQDVVEAEEARATEREEHTPEGLDAPADLPARGGRRDTAYSHDRLIAEATDFVGQPPHVVAGALATSKREYLTVADVEALVEDFLNRPVDQEG